MIKAPVGLQDLRRRIYVTAKADTFCGFRPRNFRTSAGDDGVGTWLHDTLRLFGSRRAQHPVPKVVPAR